MEKLFSKIKKETLTTDEKSQMVLNLNKYIENNPVGSFSPRPIKSPFYSTFWTLPRKRTVVLPVTAALIFVLTSGTVLASNSSLPGDTLYPVKKFNEAVQSVVAVGTKAKTKTFTEHAISRLEEARELASKGVLTEEKAIRLEKDFQKHVEKIEKNIEKLKNDGDNTRADELLSVFEDSVSLQNDDMEKLSENQDVDDDTRENLKNIKSRVENEINKRKKDRDDDKEEKKYKVENQSEQDEESVKLEHDSKDRDFDEDEDEDEDN